MKNLFYLFAVAALVLAGCKKNTTTEGGGEGLTAYTISVTAETGGEAKATYYGELVLEAVVGAEITLTATPEATYQFVRWEATGIALSNPNEKTAVFKMPENNVSFKAKFEALSYFDVTVTATTGGSVTATADGEPVSEDISEGTEITLTAIPDGVYKFVKWNATGITLDEPTDNPLTFVMPKGDVSFEAEFEVDNGLYEEGVSINGIVWATRNVDVPGRFAATPESAGMFYQWNRNVGWSTGGLDAESTTGEAWTNSNASGSEWAAANDPCPEGWRVPTANEAGALCAKSENVEGAGTSPAGRKFIDSNDSGKFIFLTASGYRIADKDGTLGYVNANGYYWTSESAATSTSTAYSLYFYKGKAYTPKENSTSRGAGLNVRCVKA